MSEKRYKSELKALGKRIQEIRLRKGLVQLDLEVRTGISRSDISKIENGKSNIEFMTLVKIAEALGVELVAFFEDSQ